MSSFFTLPVSQRKRKRQDASSGIVSKKRVTNGYLGAKDEGKAIRKSRLKRDESISSSDSEAEGQRSRTTGEDFRSSSSEPESETGAERRLRLAEQYLENIKGEVDDVGFDAEDIDKDLVAERLQEDVVCPVSVFEFTFNLMFDQGGNQRTPLSAHCRGPSILPCSEDPISLRHRHHNVHRSMPSLRLYRFEGYYPYQVGNPYSKL